MMDHPLSPLVLIFSHPVNSLISYIHVSFTSYHSLYTVISSHPLHLLILLFSTSSHTPIPHLVKRYTFSFFYYHILSFTVVVSYPSTVTCKWFDPKSSHPLPSLHPHIFLIFNPIIPYIIFTFSISTSSSSSSNSFISCTSSLLLHPIVSYNLSHSSSHILSSPTSSHLFILYISFIFFVQSYSSLLYYILFIFFSCKFS